MKRKNIIIKDIAAAALVILGAAFLPAVFSSCAHAETITQIGANIGQELGALGSNAAAAFGKTGAAWGKAFEDITPEQEYYIGRAVGANILDSYKLYNAPAQVAYVNRICGALVINSPRPEIFNGYHVNILDSSEFNAFATSGGHIFITRGLINSTVSEDTLASVIAHEIAHIQLQHGLKAIKNNRITQALVTTGTSLVNAVGETLNLGDLTGVFGDSVDEIVTAMVTNGYSQIQEFDADSEAMTLLALAGYEPSSLLEALRALEKNQASQPGGFNKTHPSPTQRIANAEKTVDDNQVKEDTRSFRAARYSAVR
jgi:predicted Zn-dependent protease